MNEAETASTAESTAQSLTQPALGLGRLIFEFGFSIVLTVALVYGTVYVLPATFNAPGESQSLISLWVGGLTSVVVLLVLSLLERILPPAGPRKSVKNWFLHLQINIFNTLVGALAAALGAVAATALVHRLGLQLGLIDLRFVTGKGLLRLIGSLWVGAIVTDFFFYWFHRTLHRTPFLWAHHKMHHMDPELEAVTVNRQNWIEYFIAALFITLPITILFKLDDFDPVQWGLVSGILGTVVATVLGLGHMNVRLQLGRASIFYCTPQIHRIHHSYLPQHLDKNYAFVFPMWDVLFGTYYAPAWNEFPPTGVTGEKEIQSFWESQIFTQREWWRMFRAWRRRRTASLDGRASA